MAAFTENQIEQIVINEFLALGYTHYNGAELSPGGASYEREFTDVVLKNRLLAAIARLNPNIPADTQAEAARKVLRAESPEWYQNNKIFHQQLTEGVGVQYRKDDRIAGDTVWLIDYDQPERNEFLVVNQFTVVEGKTTKRPDVVLFVNGLPLVVIELKNPASEKADVQAAFNQLQTYKQAIPSLFQYNALLVVSDGFEALYGSLTAARQHFVPWKSINGTVIEGIEKKTIAQIHILIQGMLNKAVLLDLIRYFIVFHTNKEQLSKIVPRYHQYFAVNKALETTKQATAQSGDKRAGVIWHTQGSGKSLSMVFYAGKLIRTLNNPTLVVLTDRNDLDDQLFETFSASIDLLRQTPVQAENREHLKQLLSVAAGGVIFTTIQKFLPEIKETITLEDGKTKKHFRSKYDKLSDRRNIVVIADEAHRSQYDFMDGFARHMRDALPNASFIGFTGTPIETTDKNTQAVFGDYIDIYDIQQAVKDGATVPIYYESRLAKLNFLEDAKAYIDAAFEELTEGEEESARQKLKLKWAALEAIVGTPQRLALVAQDIVDHFERRTAILDGKGMVVCMSRRICVALYAEIIKLKPEWHAEDDAQGVIKVVMTGSSSENETFQPHIRNKPRRKAIGERLKNPQDPLKLVIVRDMWLTGFDAPALHTLYVDKPMKGHNLMQAIARVNRVYKDKTGGLIVDYIGIATNLKDALALYTESGGKGKPAYEQEEAADVMMAKYEAVIKLFQLPTTEPPYPKGLDYTQYYTLDASAKLAFLLEAANFFTAQNPADPPNSEQETPTGTKNKTENTRKQQYLDAVTALTKAFAIAVPHPKTDAVRDDLALFQAIAARLKKLTQSAKTLTNAELESAIRQIISESVLTDGVVDIFDAAGIKKPDVSILSEEFLAEVRGMPYKNLAFELLKKLLEDEIKTREKINLVQSRTFSEMLKKAVKTYQNNLITSAQVIEELIQLAKDMREADRQGEALGLDFREYAFYTALEANDSAVAILGNDILRHIAKELLDTVRQNAKIDWSVRENIQAQMRVAIKRILRKHGYPPDMEAKATTTVLEQAKLLAQELSTQ